LLRTVDTSSKEIKVKEYFLGFFHRAGTTGKGVTETLHDMLNSLDMPLSDCRRQAYDIGSNMKGKNNGIQSCIILKNPCARHILCCAYSLNYVVDSAKSTVVY
jgi:hypothetical protein